MSLSKVPGDEELYIGGIFVLKRLSVLKDSNITHILSVVRGNLSNFDDVRNNYQCLQIEVDDVEDENLLAEFKKSNAFIRDGLGGGGGVFVHCAMGKSRSATLVLAYLLSTRHHLTPASALTLLRESRPMAEPNEGFMNQLELFYSMGCPSDLDQQPKYQRWRYEVEVKLSTDVGLAPEIDSMRFEDEQVQGKALEKAAEEHGGLVELRCRKCRRTLATTPFISVHDPSKGSSQPCTHHFLHPLSWMRPTLSQAELSGRLECPNSKCSTNLGKYAWQGMKCSCGSWVCPAFSLVKAKVDEVKRAGAGITSKDSQESEGGSSGIRMPPGMRSVKKENL